MPELVSAKYELCELFLTLISAKFMNSVKYSV